MLLEIFSTMVLNFNGEVCLGNNIYEFSFFYKKENTHLDYFIFLKMFAMSHVKQVAFFNGVDK
jgi:hypothetical protein